MEQRSPVNPIPGKAPVLAPKWGNLLGLLLIVVIVPIELRKWFGLPGATAGQLITGLLFGALLLRHDARASGMQRAMNLAVFAIMFAALAVGMESGHWSWALAIGATLVVIGLVRRGLARSRPNDR
jgi:hypothetical protein